MATHKYYQVSEDDDGQLVFTPVSRVVGQIKSFENLEAYPEGLPTPPQPLPSHNFELYPTAPLEPRIEQLERRIKELEEHTESEEAQVESVLSDVVSRVEQLEGWSKSQEYGIKKLAARVKELEDG